MSVDQVHLWVGVFEPDAPKDYFSEQYIDDDAPLSQFVSDQNENWVDHDWMELTWENDHLPIRELISRHFLRSLVVDQAVSKAEQRGIATSNVLVLVGESEISKPSDVVRDTHTLIYLGDYDFRPPEFSLENTTRDAESGDTEAQSILGGIYIFPPPKLMHLQDVNKAEYWLLKAATAGHVETYNRLYHVYAGQYGPENFERAFYWISKSVERGSSADLGYLADLYGEGKGVQRSSLLALKWEFLSVCSYSDNNYDSKLLGYMSVLNEEEVTEAETSALQWIEQIDLETTHFRGLVRNPIRDPKNQEQIKFEEPEDTKPKSWFSRIVGRFSSN